jgi:hypothetical protein
MASAMTAPIQYCAFCGKAEYEVECLVSVDRPGAVIVCNRCVDELAEFVANVRNAVSAERTNHDPIR